MALTPEEFMFEKQDRVLALLKACEHAVKHGLSFVVLVKRCKRPPRNYDRVRILPGVIGRVVGSQKRGEYFVSAPVEALVRALERVMRVHDE